MLMCFFLCQISTTKRQCVTYVTPFHITVSNSQIKTPTNSTYEPIKLCGDGDSEFLFAFFLLCFFLAIVGFGFVGFFFFLVSGIIGGFLSPSSHCHRAEADLSRLSTTQNEQDGKVLWVTKQRGLGFSRFIWNRFLIFGRCTLFVGFQQVCLWILEFGSAHLSCQQAIAMVNRPTHLTCHQDSTVTSLH